MTTGVQDHRISTRSIPLNINRGFFDKAHPSESLGARLNQWAIRLNYDLKEETEGFDVATIEKVRADIYDGIIEKLNTGSLKDEHNKNFTYRLIQYDDVKHRSADRDRIYLRIEKETLRGTLITVLCRVYKHGDYLYIGVDSYVIGRLKLGSAIFHSVLLVALFIMLGLPAIASLFAWLTSFGSPYGSIGFMALASSLGLGFLYWIYISIFWLKVIKSLFQSEGLASALRQSFNRDVTSNSFDVDDVLTHGSRIYFSGSMN